MTSAPHRMFPFPRRDVVRLGRLSVRALALGAFVSCLWAPGAFADGPVAPPAPDARTPTAPPPRLSEPEGANDEAAPKQDGDLKTDASGRRPGDAPDAAGSISNDPDTRDTQAPDAGALAEHPPAALDSTLVVEDAILQALRGREVELVTADGLVHGVLLGFDSNVITYGDVNGRVATVDRRAVNEIIDVAARSQVASTRENATRGNDFAYDDDDDEEDADEYYSEAELAAQDKWREAGDFAASENGMNSGLRWAAIGAFAGGCFGTFGVIAAVVMAIVVSPDVVLPPELERDPDLADAYERGFESRSRSIQFPGAIVGGIVGVVTSLVVMTAVIGAVYALYFGVLFSSVGLGPRPVPL